MSASQQVWNVRLAEETKLHAGSCGAKPCARSTGCWQPMDAVTAITRLRRVGAHQCCEASACPQFRRLWPRVVVDEHGGNGPRVDSPADLPGGVFGQGGWLGQCEVRQRDWLGAMPASTRDASPDRWRDPWSGRRRLRMKPCPLSIRYGTIRFKTATSQRINAAYNTLGSILAIIDGARLPVELADLPGIHPLRGNLAGYWSVRVNRQGRVVFRLDDEDNARDIDFVDCH